MKIENLDTFCKVVERGSINQVAKEKFISQPAITRQIRQLEEKYNTLLFDRKKGNLFVTKEGEILYKLFKEILNKYHYSFQVIDEFKGKDNNELIIGASLTIGEYLLPKLLGGFKRENPTTDIKLDITSTPKVLQSLLNDKVSIALVEGEVDNTQLITKKYAEDELIIVCSANHSRWNHMDYISLSEFAKEKMIWREESSGTRRILEKQLMEQGHMNNINIYMELGSTQAIKKAVEIDLGIAILSKLAVERELEIGSLKRVFIRGINFKRSFWIVQKERHYYRNIVRSFYRYILNEKSYI